MESEAEEEMTCHHEPGENAGDHSILALPTAPLLKGKGAIHLSPVIQLQLPSLPSGEAVPLTKGGENSDHQKKKKVFNDKRR